MSEQPNKLQPEPGRRRLKPLGARARSALVFIAGVLAALVALLLFNTLAPGPQPLTRREVSDTVAQVMASATPPPPVAIAIRQLIQPSLVLIQTEVAREPGAGESDGAENSTRPRYGLGSGVVINDKGNILTSLHVVEGMSDIRVTFGDGTESSAFIVASQPENDIAVLQAEQPPAQIVPAMLGNPGAVRIGDDAYVVGHPLGLYGSMSTGVISGLDRSFQPSDSDQELTGLIQIDAAVNPGNSGGPLLNRYGQVIGIVAGLANPAKQDAFSGIGFAVPINVAGGAAGLPPY